MWAWALALLLQAAPHAERGWALAQRGDFKGAETELREAVRLEPRNGTNLALLGMALAGQNRFGDAAACFERALKIDPSDTGTRYNLATMQFRMGQFKAAESSLEEVLRRDASHKQAAALLAEVHYGRALELYKSGNTAASEALLERLATASRNPRVFNLLAWCRHRKGRTEEALAAARRAIELAPREPEWYASAARILLDSGMLQPAYATAREALSLKPDFVPALKVAATIDLKRSALKQAFEGFRQASALSPDDPELAHGLAAAQRALYDYAGARATLEKAIARFPSFAPLYEASGELLLDPGAGLSERARAAGLLERALTLDPSLSGAHYALGKMLQEDGETQRALPHLEAAAKAEPRNARFHLALADAYRMAGRREDQARELKLYRELQ